MAERQSVAQVQQLGKEATPGTAVPATKRLGSMSLSPGISAEVSTFRPTGLKFATVQALNQEWVEGDLEGQPTYDEVVYPLSGAMGRPVSSQIMDAATPTGAYQHVFTPKSDQADTVDTFTLEQGDAVASERIAHLLFTGFSLSLSRSEVSMGGSFIGKAVEKGVAMTPGLDIPADMKTILPGHFSAYTATSGADLGTTQTKLLRLISAAPSIGDRYAPAWFVNQSEQSFTTWVENAEGASSEAGMTLEADTNGMAFLDKLRDGSTVFLRLEALGPEIKAGVAASRYRFTWDMALKANAVDTWSDEDGIWAIPFTFQAVHDATWAKSQTITVVNTLPTV